MSKFLIVLLTFILTACGSVPLNESAQKEIKSVAVISLVPERVNVLKIGLTVFNNDRTAINTSGHIGSTIVSTAKAAITASHPHWVVKDIQYDPEALFKRMNTSGMVMSSSVEKIDKDLGEIAAKNGVDAILVISEAQYDSMPGRGATVAFRSASSTIGSGVVYGNIAASIVNQRGSIIAGANNGHKLTHKLIDVSNYEVKTPLQENLKPEVVGVIGSAVKEVLGQNVNLRLKELGLATAKLR